MQLLALAFDPAFVGELPEHGVQARPVGVLQAEGARQLARADPAVLRRDEGEHVVS